MRSPLARVSWRGERSRKALWRRWHCKGKGADSFDFLSALSQLTHVPFLKGNINTHILHRGDGSIGKVGSLRIGKLKT